MTTPADGWLERAEDAACRVLGADPARRPAERWHVSPLVDASAYHFSWLIALVPLLLCGARFPGDYLLIFYLIGAGNVAHQSLTLYLLWLDGELLARDRARLLAAPVLALGGACACLALAAAGRPEYRAAMIAASSASYAWNFWHVYMQKYGLFRLYDAKARPGPGPRTPPWNDRLFVLAWLPLYFAVLGPRRRDFLLASYPLMRGALEPLTAALAAAAPWLVPASTGLIAASAVLFVLHERRAGGPPSAPRLSLALGMTGLSAAILLFDPIKAVLAFGFSHVVEYFVFVWAYERRRAAPDGTPRVAHPGLLLLAFAATAVPVFFLIASWGRYWALGRPFAAPGGVPLDRVGAVLVIYQSLAHFYADGLMWKVRRPEVRSGL